MLARNPERPTPGGKRQARLLIPDGAPPGGAGATCTSRSMVRLLCFVLAEVSFAKDGARRHGVVLVLFPRPGPPLTVTGRVSGARAGRPGPVPNCVKFDTLPQKGEHWPVISEVGRDIEHALKLFLVEVVAQNARDLRHPDGRTRQRARHWFTEGEETACPVLGLASVCSALDLDHEVIRKGALAARRQVRGAYRRRAA